MSKSCCLERTTACVEVLNTASDDVYEDGARFDLLVPWRHRGVQLGVRTQVHHRQPVLKYPPKWRNPLRCRHPYEPFEA
jgi:hypothetical protein